MTAQRDVFEFQQFGDCLLIVPHGPFLEFRDNDIRNAYNEAYRRLSEPGSKHLCVDFSCLEYFGSTFVGILIRLAKKARANGGEAVLCHLSDNMTDLLRTLMLLENPKTDFYWTPYPSRAEALKAIGQSA